MVVLLPIVLYSGGLAISTMFNAGSIWHFETASCGCVYGASGLSAPSMPFSGIEGRSRIGYHQCHWPLIGGMMIPILDYWLLATGGSLSGGVSRLMTELPEKFIAAGGKSSSIPFATIFTGMMLITGVLLGTNQAHHPKGLSSQKSERRSKRIDVGCIHQNFRALDGCFARVIAFYLYKDQISIPDQAYPTLVR